MRANNRGLSSHHQSLNRPVSPCAIWVPQSSGTFVERGIVAPTTRIVAPPALGEFEASPALALEALARVLLLIGQEAADVFLGDWV